MRKTCVDIDCACLWENHNGGTKRLFAVHRTSQHTCGSSKQVEGHRKTPTMSDVYQYKHVAVTRRPKAVVFVVVVVSIMTTFLQDDTQCTCYCEGFALTPLPFSSRVRSLEKTTKRRKWTSLSLSDFMEDEEQDGGLTEAGNLIASIGSKTNNRLLSAFGEALRGAGHTWANDWSETTNHLANAAESCRLLANDAKNDDSGMMISSSTVETTPTTTTRVVGPKASKTFYRMADELEEASSIQGCSSIGPPTAIPNLEALCLLFGNIAADKKTDGTIRGAFQDAREHLQVLIRG